MKYIKKILSLWFWIIPISFAIFIGWFADKYQVTFDSGNALINIIFFMSVLVEATLIILALSETIE